MKKSTKGITKYITISITTIIVIALTILVIVKPFKNDLVTEYIVDKLGGSVNYDVEFSFAHGVTTSRIIEYPKTVTEEAISEALSEAFELYPPGVYP